MHMKLNLLPLSLALFMSASLHSFELSAQENEETPSNPEIASPTTGDQEAMQGMRVEEGLGESEPEGMTEGQQSYVDNKAQEDEEIKKEEADAEVDAAEAQEIQASEEPFEEPFEEAGVGVGVGIRAPIVTPVVE